MHGNKTHKKQRVPGHPVMDPLCTQLSRLSARLEKQGQKTRLTCPASSRSASSLVACVSKGSAATVQQSKEQIPKPATPGKCQNFWVPSSPGWVKPCLFWNMLRKLRSAPPSCLSRPSKVAGFCGLQSTLTNDSTTLKLKT